MQAEAHDLTNILAVISAEADFGLRDTVSNPVFHARFTLIRAKCFEASAILKNIPDKLETLEICSLIRSLQKLLDRRIRGVEDLPTIWHAGGDEKT